MADDNYAYEDVKLAVRIKDEDGIAEIGAVVDGAFFALGGAKLAGFYEDVKEAQQAKAQQQEQAEQRQQESVTGPPAQESVVPPEAQPQ